MEQNLNKELEILLDNCTQIIIKSHRPNMQSKEYRLDVLAEIGLGKDKTVLQIQIFK